ncbi:MAG: aldose 1-epimerase family protein [Erysipelotrichaceae bacterium]|nr:aldose 1-epimerase family protein [Erysipelotrichaceae bacterium]
MKIANERYEMTFCEKGGEMTSFRDKQTGIQYLYQGDSEYWSGKNPTLFPIVGNTHSGTYEIDGKQYAMKNHGLIRYATLTCIEQTEDSITFECTDSEETRKQYPFSFCYHITYYLEGNRCTITYHITNTDDRDMPFTFGLHPGFRCPLTSDEKFEDYHLIFNNHENITQLLFDPERKQPVIKKAVKVKDIQLSYPWLIEPATVIYEGCKSTHVTLQGKEHGVKVSIAGYPYLAFWTPQEKAPFICIEPWYGHTDFTCEPIDFSHREGMMNLSAGKTFTTSYTIEVF